MTQKILIAPGAFKHSLSASQVAAAIARGLQRANLDATWQLLPVADGGNGTLEAFLSADLANSQQIAVQVENPVGDVIDSAFGVVDETAIIEMALASGIELIAPLAPMTASTYGTGQLLQAALDHGVKRVIVGMGGSATTDGGAGALQALGVRLLDANGDDIPRGGGGLAALHHIDISGLDARWRDVEVIIASDVDNPAIGAEGAAAIFSPQKGASPAQVAQLDANLTHFFSVIAAQTGVEVSQRVGGGAAGAFAAGLMAFLGGRIESGIDLILAHHQFDAALQGAALVITGEGALDAQSVRGKTPLGIARRAKAAGVPVVAIVGGLLLDDEALHAAGIQAGIPIVPFPMPLADAIAQAEVLVERAAMRLAYLLQL